MVKNKSSIDHNGYIRDEEENLISRKIAYEKIWMIWNQGFKLGSRKL